MLEENSFQSSLLKMQNNQITQDNRRVITHTNPYSIMTSKYFWIISILKSIVSDSIAFNCIAVLTSSFKIIGKKLEFCLICVGLTIYRWTWSHRVFSPKANFHEEFLFYFCRQKHVLLSSYYTYLPKKLNVLRWKMLWN